MINYLHISTYRPKISGLVLAILLLGMQQGIAQVIEFEKYQLANGLKVILHQDSSTPIVAVTVSYKVGSKNEDPARTGFAHFFEHLLFEGSENIGRGEYMKLVKTNGGVLNANTFYDRTFYFEILPSNQLELGLWMESERMLHAKIEDQGIETQREVVKEERRQRYDNTPYGGLLDQTMRRTFLQHPYGRSVIGSMDHLNSAKREEFMDFYRTFYVPDNAVLSIAGDFRTEQVKAWVNRYFGTIPTSTRPIPRPNPAEPAQTAERIDTVYDNIQLPAIVHSFKMPAQGTPDFYPMSMLTSLLSQGASSRFQKSIADRQQKAVAVGAFPLGMVDHGVAIMYGIVNMGVSADTLNLAMKEEYRQIREETVQQSELNKLLTQLESDRVAQLGTVQGIAEQLSDYELFYGDANLINTEFERFRKVTPEDIRRVANTYLVPSNQVTLYYMPKPKP